MTAPIERQHHASMNALADVIDDVLNGNGPRKVVFALLVAETGGAENARVNYISTADRSDMLSMMREFIARAEGAVSGPAGQA